MLVDFGIAKIYDAKTGTTKGAQAITPGYSAPEQYGQGDTDARSDIYSLGATLYTLLTSKIPEESVQRMLGKPLIPPRQLNPQISPAVEASILKAMQLQPDHRYQGTAQFKVVVSQQLPKGDTTVTPIPTQQTDGLEIPETEWIPHPRIQYPWKKFALLATALFAALFLVAGITMIGYKLLSNNQSSQITQELRTIEGEKETSQPIELSARLPPLSSHPLTQPVLQYYLSPHHIPQSLLLQKRSSSQLPPPPRTPISEPHRRMEW